MCGPGFRIWSSRILGSHPKSLDTIPRTPRPRPRTLMPIPKLNRTQEATEWVSGIRNYRRLYRDYDCDAFLNSLPTLNPNLYSQFGSLLFLFRSCIPYEPPVRKTPQIHNKFLNSKHINSQTTKTPSLNPIHHQSPRIPPITPF